MRVSIDASTYHHLARAHAQRSAVSQSPSTKHLTIMYPKRDCRVLAAKYGGPSRRSRGIAAPRLPRRAPKGSLPLPALSLDTMDSTDLHVYLLLALWLVCCDAASPGRGGGPGGVRTLPTSLCGESSVRAFPGATPPPAELRLHPML